MEPSIPPVDAAPHGGQVEHLRRKRVEPCVEPSVPPGDTVPHGSQVERL